MVRQLLLKDYRKRPSIVEVLSQHAMKQRMALYGYSESDHLLTSTQAGPAFKSNIQADKLLLQQKQPNVDALRKQL